MKKKFLLLAFSSLFISSCAELNSALESVNKSMESISESNMPKLQSASATKICNDFSNNEISAKQKWIGLYVSMSGKVDEVKENTWGKPSVDFSVSNSVNVLALPKTGMNLQKLNKGDRVVFKGIINDVMRTGLSCNIFLDKTSF